MSNIKADLCIIGAGSAGLSVAAGAAQLGLYTVLIEKDRMGGDCLNTGCVPSKALLAAARRAQGHRKSDIAGIAAYEPVVDFAAVKTHVAAAIRQIEPHDSKERFESLGVRVIRAEARFTGRQTVAAGEFTITARHFVIAAGSAPVVPKIDGLEADRVLTNENIFTLKEKPEHLLVIGGGPIGVEMAQAHRRLGCRVSVFSQSVLLPRDDPQNVAILRKALRREGVAFYENAAVTAVSHDEKGVTVTVEKEGKILNIAGSHLLVAAGRKPNTDGLGLEQAGVAVNDKGIVTDSRLRTTNRKIYVIGDITGGPQFTHVAGYHAGIVIRNICFKISAKTDYRALPWVTYTDPEIAQAGMTEAQARETYGDKVTVIEAPFAQNDRAVTEALIEGQLRVVADRKGNILGASLIGPHAGEMIGLWQLAMTKRMKLKDLTGMIVPYPTFSEISKSAAGQFYKSRLFSDKTRRLVRLLQKLPL